MITTCIIFERIFFILTRGKKLKTSHSAINNKKQHSLPCSHQAKGQCRAELMLFGGWAHLISGQAVSGVAAAVCEDRGPRNELSVAVT